MRDERYRGHRRVYPIGLHPGYKEARFATTSVHLERSPTETEAAVKEPVTGSLMKRRPLGRGEIVAVEATAVHVSSASESRYPAEPRRPKVEVFLRVGSDTNSSIGPRRTGVPTCGCAISLRTSLAERGPPGYPMRGANARAPRRVHVRAGACRGIGPEDRLKGV